MQSRRLTECCASVVLARQCIARVVVGFVFIYWYMMHGTMKLKHVSILTVVTLSGQNINPLYLIEGIFLQMVLKLTDILDDPICFTNDHKNYSKNILQKLQIKWWIWPTSGLTLFPPAPRSKLYDTSRTNPPKKRDGWKSKETGTKLQRSERDTHSATSYSLWRRWLQKETVNPFRKM